MGRRKRESMAQPLLLTVPDVAIQLGVCRASVYNYFKRNGLPYIKIGGHNRVHPDDLKNWMQQNKVVGLQR